MCEFVVEVYKLYGNFDSMMGVIKKKPLNEHWNTMYKECSNWIKDMHAKLAKVY